MEKIINGRDLAHRDGAATQREWITERCRHLVKQRLLDTPFTGQVTGNPVQAMINHGRWIALCPKCGGAEYVDPYEKIFYCFSCGNAALKGHARPVEFPDNRKEIEQAVLQRPVLAVRGTNAIQRAILAVPLTPGFSRTWMPGETLEDLKRQMEEVQHGL